MALWNTGRFDDIRLETRTRTQRRSGSCASSSPSGAWCAPSSTKATSRSPFRKFWTASRSARSACRSNRSTIPTRCSAPRVVIKEYLAERGRQFATVEPEVRQIPPSSLEIVFKVERRSQGQGRQDHYRGQSSASANRDVMRAMKNLHGHRHSAFHLVRKYLRADLRFHQARRRQGAHPRRSIRTTATSRPRCSIRRRRFVDTGGHGFTHSADSARTSPARRRTSPSGGRRPLYHLNKINFMGVKLFRTPETLMRPLFR